MYSEVQGDDLAPGDHEDDAMARPELPLDGVYNPTIPVEPPKVGMAAWVFVCVGGGGGGNMAINMKSTLTSFWWSCKCTVVWLQCA